MDSDSRRLAVLIDGDSIKPAYFGSVLAWAARHDVVAIRRIYGRHTKLADWKECIKRHEIELMPTYVDYKNAADITLTIHAVEIFYSMKRDRRLLHRHPATTTLPAWSSGCGTRRLSWQ